MHKILNKELLIITLVIVFSSCGLMYRVLLGVDTSPSWQLEDGIILQAKKYNIPEQYNLVLDTSAYYAGLNELYNTLFQELEIEEKDSTEYLKLKNVFKDDSQPVQFRLFDKSGAEIFKMVNCYVDPPIPMNWNVDGCFDSFPPKTTIESLNSHNFDLNFVLSKASTLSEKKLQLSDLPQSDYYGVIMWNGFFKRPSKNLIKTVRNKIKDSNESVLLLFINNQNAYLWQVMDDESKSKVKALDYNK